MADLRKRGGNKTSEVCAPMTSLRLPKVGYQIARPKWYPEPRRS